MRRDRTKPEQHPAGMKWVISKSMFREFYSLGLWPIEAEVDEWGVPSVLTRRDKSGKSALVRRVASELFSREEHVLRTSRRVLREYERSRIEDARDARLIGEVTP